MICSLTLASMILAVSQTSKRHSTHNLERKRKDWWHLMKTDKNEKQRLLATSMIDRTWFIDSGNSAKRNVRRGFLGVLGHLWRHLFFHRGPFGSSNTNGVRSSWVNINENVSVIPSFLALPESVLSLLMGNHPLFALLSSVESSASASAIGFGRSWLISWFIYYKRTNKRYEDIKRVDLSQSHDPDWDWDVFVRLFDSFDWSSSYHRQHLRVLDKILPNVGYQRWKGLPTYDRKNNRFTWNSIRSAPVRWSTGSFSYQKNPNHPAGSSFHWNGSCRTDLIQWLSLVHLLPLRFSQSIN